MSSRGAYDQHTVEQTGCKAAVYIAVLVDLEAWHLQGLLRTCTRHLSASLINTIHENDLENTVCGLENTEDRTSTPTPCLPLCHPASGKEFVWQPP
jgi:hypothetical protein